MQLDKLTVNIRPISADEAIDLGLNIARAWYWDLLGLWCYRARYFLVMLGLLFAWFFYQGQVNVRTLIWVMVFFYFAKPYFEVAELLYLSRKLFDQSHRPSATKAITVSFWQAFKLTLTTRFRYQRTMIMAISLLENQKSKALAERLRLLSRGSANAMIRHGLAFALIEMLLFFGAVLLSLELLSASYLGESIFQWFDRFDVVPVWLAGLFVVVYIACVALLSPFFVASGFALYVCRRSLLEGWDIELSFRTLAKRYQEQSQIKWQKMP